MIRRATLACLLAGTAAGVPAADAATPALRAGAGKADIQPATGYYLGGWTRADRLAAGQHTRLQARALVLQRAERKVALVAVDLFGVTGGIVAHLGKALADRGLSEQTILVSASHTHSGPGGFANFPGLNTAAPSVQTVTDPLSFFRLISPSPADPQLYRFLVERIATAIRRADDDLAPAAAGWGSAQLTDVTQNRSLEAHLHNHGIVKARGEGRPEDDPQGALHTIDPTVDVLRVDHVVGGRRVPIGAWSVFADHGTVTKSSFPFYNADHHGSAMRVFEAKVRRDGRVPARQEVVNVYGNANEGDMSAGLVRHGPAASDEVGRREAAAMLDAWSRAGRNLRRRPALDVRWTRICFCGQAVEGGGRVAAESEVGLPFLTGSEEERGPLYDVTGVPFEDVRSPVDRGDPHGLRLSAPAGGIPNGVPLLAVRVGPTVIVSIPGEGTKEVGARLRTAVASAVAGSGITRVAISGVANEFVLYFTTPEEYDRQHYEGGNTHFGRWSSVLVQQEAAGLAGRLARGEPAQQPYPFDPTNGVTPDGPVYPDGAQDGRLLEQPADRVERLRRVTLAWQGGPRGLDRPVDTAFVTAQRRVGARWTRADDDLGLAMLWRVDADGRYDLAWEVPRDAPAETYRFVVTAKRYRLESRSFQVVASDALRLVERTAPSGRIAVALAYPEAVRDIDLTYRPRFASGGAVTFRVDSRPRRVRLRRGTDFEVVVPPGAEVVVASARDRHGNRVARPSREALRAPR